MLNQDSTMPLIETRKGGISIGASQPTMESSLIETGEDEKQNIKKEFAHAK